MSIKNIAKNIASRGLKDALDPGKWSAMAQGNEIKKNGMTLEADEIISYSEQVLYRKSLCPECFQAGECQHCHCEMPIAGLTPVNYCSEGKWGKMLSKEEWEEFKNENNINIGIQ